MGIFNKIKGLFTNGKSSNQQNTDDILGSLTPAELDDPEISKKKQALDKLNEELNRRQTEWVTFNETIEQQKKLLSELEQKLSEVEQGIEKAPLAKSLSELEAEIKKATLKRDAVLAMRESELNFTREQQKKIVSNYSQAISELNNNLSAVRSELNKKQGDLSSTEQKLSREKEKLKTARDLYKKIQTVLADNFTTDLYEQDKETIDTLIPTVELPLHSYDIKELKALSRQNNKILEDTLARYEKRYTTKANKAIYQLMVIALRAELQNILIGMKYTTLDKCKSDMRKLIIKYTQIAADGNQTIAPTLNSFIAEIDILFNKTIDIEYNYYIKKEQEKAEQQALREQMRQEEEERKALEQQRKQVEKEEQKYKDRILEVEQMLNDTADNDTIKQLQARIQELQQQLSAVEEQKEEIIKLQNGKAGYVYVISNLGSFGENTFKIGMTRRLEPMERIRELSSASVPFVFDVHSFIFSDDAVGLENKLHTILNDRRTNRINMRKEFFNISVDELEKIVQDIDSTAEFNKTMIASEYRQTLAMNEEK